MASASSDSISVVLLDADEQFRTLMAHHITAAWPDAEIESLGSLADMDESVRPHCFVLDHMTLQRAANSADESLWFRAAAAIASSPCIVVAEPSDELLAVRYMKGGAKDFLPKRLIKHELFVSSISECLEHFASPEMAAEIEQQRAKPKSKPAKRARKKRKQPARKKPAEARNDAVAAADPFPDPVAEAVAADSEPAGLAANAAADPPADAPATDNDLPELVAEPAESASSQPGTDSAAPVENAADAPADSSPDTAANEAVDGLDAALEQLLGEVIAPDSESASGQQSADEFEPDAMAQPDAAAEPDQAAEPEAAAVAEQPESDEGTEAKVNGKRNSAVALRSGGGPVINGYRIIRPIAKGGIASVCLAHSEPLGHDVALKVLRISKSTAANKLYERFEQEYRLVSTIDSPSVVKTYDFGRTKREVYIALEYFPCGDLRTRLKDPITDEEALDFVQKIATALQELHALNIMHRDLKPANVMLREDDSIALIDFGMAKQLQSSENLTLPGTVHGTPHYLSPEQAKGKAVDARSDIYSLGIMLYEMLERKKPYTSKNALEVCMAHISDPVPTLSADNAALQPILDWMMAKDIDERCPNMAELLTVLQSEGVNPGV